jgi:hypothetical protein
MLLAFFASAASASAATVTVTTVGDDITPNDGSVSLREAITSINAGNDLGDPDITAQVPGTYGTNDSISFNMPGSGVRVIHVGADPSAAGVPLPAIVKALAMSGTTQPGGATPIPVLLDGASAGSGAIGLNVKAKVTIAVLGVENFHLAGIALSDTAMTSSSQSIIGGNFIGLNSAGTAAAPNGAGIVVNSSNVTITANVVSGNGVPPGTGAITVNGNSNLIDGNSVGTNPAGTAALGNAGAGVAIAGSNNTLGGTSAGVHNVISGNASDGVSLGGSGNLVEGNFIGTDRGGSAAVPNGGAGVALGGAGQKIQGSAAAPQKIWFNGGFGIIDQSQGDFFHVNSIKGNGAGGISVAGNVRTASLALSADRSTLTVSFGKVTPGQAVTIEGFENPGAPGCPGQGETFLGTATTTASDTGTGSVDIPLAQPAPADAGLTATLTDPLQGTTPFFCLDGGVPGSNSSAAMLLAHTVTINPHTRAGKVKAGCAAPAGDHCKVTGKLTTGQPPARAQSAQRKAVKRGTITGTIPGGGTAKLKVKVTRTTLKRLHKHKLKVSVSATSTIAAGASSPLRGRLTLKLKRRR